MTDKREFVYVVECMTARASTWQRAEPLTVTLTLRAGKQKATELALQNPACHYRVSKYFTEGRRW